MDRAVAMGQDAVRRLLPLLTGLIVDLTHGPSSDGPHGERQALLGCRVLIVACILKGRFPHYTGPMHAVMSQMMHSQHASWRLRDLMCRLGVVTSALTEQNDALRRFRVNERGAVFRQMIASVTGPCVPGFVFDNANWM
eukprot:gene52643-20489_t